jgi:N-acetylglucosamine-6-phosphate deacetylase
MGPASEWPWPKQPSALDHRRVENKWRGELIAPAGYNPNFPMSSARYGITARVLLTPEERIERPLIVVEEGRIVSVASQEEAETPANLRVTDFPEGIVAPGFVEIHVHGGGGHDVMEGSEDALGRIERHLASTGVTSYFPTTVTAPLDSTLAALEKLGTAIERARQRREEGRAQPLGIHLEGPFLSHAKCGVHPREHIQPPSLELLERLWQAARGRIGMMTLAPEVAGAMEVIREGARRGVCVSLGHSNSGLEEAQAAIEAGARHATHTFNAMRALDHRDPGILGAVLADARLSADIIADGVHVHPEMVRLFLRAKGGEKAVLITDAISATGMGDGCYRLGGLEVEVRGERCLLVGKLAGSVLTMDRAVGNIMRFAGWSLQDAVRLATRNPAEVAGVSKRAGDGTGAWKGMVAPGADADLVVLTPSGRVMETIARGVAVQGSMRS